MDQAAKNGLGSAKALRMCLDARRVEARAETYAKYAETSRSRGCVEQD
jgi:hypothetical protein